MTQPAVAACSTCKFWEPPSTQTAPAAGEEVLRAPPGRCHFHAPMVLTQANLQTMWPRTYAADWCGQYVSAA